MALRLSGAGIGLAVGIASVSAHAWKPSTHVYLAQQAVEDLLEDGKVTIDELDPKATDPDKRIKGPIGTFTASPAIVKAIREYPGAYYTGVVGPDGLPDIGTGQCVIHPPAGSDPLTNIGGPGTDYWWQRSWNGLHEAKYNTDENRAFVLGMYGHGGGDTFAHTFVNAHTGGIWDLTGNGGENAIRHIILEGYLGERTPELAHHRFLPHEGKTLYQLVHDQGMTDGIAKFNRMILDSYQLRDHAGAQKAKSIPWHFGRLKERLKTTRDRYKLQRNKIKDRYETAKATLTKAKKQRKKALHSGKGIIQAEAAVIAAQGAKTGLEVELKLHDALSRVVVPFYEEWISNIDEGLLAWPKTSHAVLQPLMLKNENDPRYKACPPSTVDMVCEQGGPEKWRASTTNLCKSPLSVASEALHDFWWAYGIRMIGAPDKASEVIMSVRDLVKDFKQVLEKHLAEAIAPFLEFAVDIKVKTASFANVMIKKSFGLDMCKWADRWTHSSGYIDDLFAAKHNAGTGTAFQELANSKRSEKGIATSVEGLNQMMGLKTKKATGEEHFKWRDFAPAFNTVQLIKMTFLPPNEIERLLGLLGSKEHLNANPSRDIKEIKGDLNVMHGWHGGLDGGNQWAHNWIPTKSTLTPMVFARECSVFRRLFMHQSQPHTDKPYEPNDPCETSDTAVYSGARPKSSQGFSISSRHAEMEAGASRHFDLTGDFKSFTVTATSEPGSPTGTVTAKDAKGFTFTAPSWKEGMHPISVTAQDDSDERTFVLIRIIPAIAIEPAIDAVTIGDKVTFDVTTDRNDTWRVTKGPGHFGDGAKIASLKAAIEAKRAARVSAATLETALETEMHTYYAPANAKDGDRVEIEVTLAGDDKGSGRKLTEAFELVVAEK